MGIVYEDILLRPVERRDIESIRLLRNDESTFMQLTDASLITPAQQDAWFEALGTAKDRAFFTVVQVERDGNFPVMSEGTFVGIVRLSAIDKTNRSICIGADVAPAMRGRGYGTKIYKALLRYLIEDLNFNRCWLLVLETNAVARRLYENIGFTVEGVQRAAIWRDGAWRDYVLMSILADEYRAGAR